MSDETHIKLQHSLQSLENALLRLEEARVSSPVQVAHEPLANRMRGESSIEESQEGLA